MPGHRSFTCALAAATALVDVVESFRMGIMSGAEEYEQFLNTMGVRRAGESAEKYAQRRQLYEEQIAFVQRHNSNPDRLWTAGINRFSDYTKEEFNALLGHIPSYRRGQQPRPKGSVLLQQQSGVRAMPSQDTIAATVSWSQGASKVKDQGSCGSCWAVSSSSVMEMRQNICAENNHRQKLDAPISFQQIVARTPNLNKCGGHGGCGGSTAELAFQYVQDEGVHLHSNYKCGYMTTHDEKCEHYTPSGEPVLKIAEWVKLPVNDYHDLLAELTKGPVVVSVDASYWNAYSHGIFGKPLAETKNDPHAFDAVVNHAVAAIGFGETDGLKYWLIQNSWGPHWGEEGLIKILRDENDSENCGVDKKPWEGTFCEEGPKAVPEHSEQPVCGTSGILSDSVFVLYDAKDCGLVGGHHPTDVSM